MNRITDLILSALLLIALTPLLLVVSILVWSKLGSPILFRQARTGKNGRLFQLFKFRTMTNGVDASDNLLPDDQRLTKFGAFLRSSSLDELPTLLNVILGHMSLVGPRPLLPHYLPRYNAFQARRHEVRPGVTGWAQINGRNRLSWENKFSLDVWYVENKSLSLDLKILFLTAGSVLSQKDITAEGNATMPEFMGTPKDSTDWTQQSGIVHDLGCRAMQEGITWKLAKKEASQ